MSGFQAALASLPSNVNPYSFVDQFLFDAVNPPTNPWFFRATHGVVGLYLACIAFALVGLVSRWRRGRFWLFKTRLTPTGRLILPSTNTLFALCSIFLSAFMMINAYLYTESLKGKISPIYAFTAYTWAWMPLIFGVLFEAWGLCVAVYLSKAPVKVGGLKISAVVLNAFFLSQFILQVALNTPAYAIVCYYIQKGWADYLSVSAALGPAIALWQPGQPMRSDPAVIATIASYAHNMNQAIRYLKPAFILHLVCHAIIAAIFVPVAVIYLTILRKQIKSSSQMTQSSMSPPVRSKLGRFHVLRSQYVQMVSEAFFVIVATLLLCGCSLWIAIDTAHIVESGNLRAINFIMAFYIFAVFGTLVNAMIAYRTLASRPTRENGRASEISSSGTNGDSREGFSPLSLLHGVQVHTEVHQHVDIALEKASVVDLKTFGVQQYEPYSPQETKSELSFADAL